MLVGMNRLGRGTVVVLAGLLTTAVSVAEPMVPPDLERRLRVVHQSRRGHAQRLEAVSRLFLGAPFAPSPLGEGPGHLPDADPIMDLSRFDCVTFVEQVMALSWHADLEQASRVLQRIRYTEGRIRYGARKHIMMAQWIPQNVAAGFVRDITAEVAGEAAQTVVLSVRDEDFEGGLGRRLALAPADRPVGTFSLPVVGLVDLSSKMEAVPYGTIVTTIREARPGVPYRASHVGLVFEVRGERRIRHAYRRAAAVVDEPLASFVRRCRRLRNPHVVGFNLLAIADRPPRPQQP